MRQKTPSRSSIHQYWDRRIYLKRYKFTEKIRGKQLDIVCAPRDRYHVRVVKEIKRAGVILPLKQVWLKAQRKGHRLWKFRIRKYTK